MAKFDHQLRWDVGDVNPDTSRRYGDDLSDRPDYLHHEFVLLFGGSSSADVPVDKNAIPLERLAADEEIIPVDNPEYHFSEEALGARRAVMGARNLLRDVLLRFLGKALNASGDGVCGHSDLQGAFVGFLLLSLFSCAYNY
jgi:hypothetical protein